MPDLNKTYLFRMTHIENIPHIIQNGITHSKSASANPNFTPIGDGSVIATRNNFLLDNGRRLGEYIPFYFGVRTLSTPSIGETKMIWIESEEKKQSF